MLAKAHGFKSGLMASKLSYLVFSFFIKQTLAMETLVAEAQPFPDKPLSGSSWSKDESFH